MYPRIKRMIDIVCSAAGLLGLFPLLLALALLIRLDSPGKAIYKQTRLGKDGKPFTMHKFRTMLEGTQRVTRVGRILRIGVDELPQLWDVLRGEMSLVGPRPVLPDEPMLFEEYTPKQRKMFSVRPGITGWAQVHGRRSVPWDQRIDMNVWYVEHATLELDARILLMTIGTLLSGKDNE